MYDFIIIYMDLSTDDEEIPGELIVHYNTQVLTLDKLESLLNTYTDLDELNEILTVDFDSYIVNKDNIKHYEFYKKRLLQVY